MRSDDLVLRFIPPPKRKWPKREPRAIFPARDFEDVSLRPAVTRFTDAASSMREIDDVMRSRLETELAFADVPAADEVRSQIVYSDGATYRRPIEERDLGGGRTWRRFNTGEEIIRSADGALEISYPDGTTESRSADEMDGEYRACPKPRLKQAA